MSPQSLSEAELERVREILDRFGDKRAMNLEQIDGFLAALVCGPDDIPQSEYLPEIWGDGMVNEAAFAGQPILQVFVSLIMRHRDAIAHTLRTDAVYTPLLLQDQDGLLVVTIGQMGLCVGWSCVDNFGLRLLTTTNKEGLLCPSLPWHTNTIPILRCAPMTSPSVQNFGKS